VAAPTIPDSTKTVEEAVSHAVGHRIRIEILAILNEGPKSPSQIAKLIGQNVSKVNNHIMELLRSRSIELARTDGKGNHQVNFYRAIETPMLEGEDFNRLPEEERREIISLALQATIAEALASFWAGEMVHDKNLWLAWRWFNVDAQGRREIEEEQAAHWGRIVEIEARSSSRRAESKEGATSTIVASMGFRRGRRASAPPWSRG
jgi:DNA-binding transcriptional ArsR family regulator